LLKKPLAISAFGELDAPVVSGDGGLIVIAVTVYRYDRTPSCGRSGNDLQ